MKKNRYRLLPLSLLGGLLIFAAFVPAGTAKLFWTDGKKLTWNDFKGPVDSTAKEDAETTWHIDARYAGKGDTARMVVKCWFAPDESWVKKNHLNADLLAHEQAHFDLAEVYARKLRKELASKTYTRTDLKTSFKSAHQQLIGECKKRQEQYDTETNHSIIKAKQTEWQKLIAKELGDLKSYADTLVMAKINP